MERGRRRGFGAQSRLMEAGSRKPSMQTNRFVWLVLVAACVPLVAQDREAPPPGGLVVEVQPAELTLAVGGTRRLAATVRRADGTVVDDARVVFYSRARRSVSVTRRGDVEAHRPGEFTLVALVPASSGAAAGGPTRSRGPRSP